MKTWVENRDGKSYNVVSSVWEDIERMILDRRVSEVSEHIGVTDLNSAGFLKNKPVKIGVNWYAIGTVEPMKAEYFAADIQKVALMAKCYKYNGYYIKYIPLSDLDAEEKEELQRYATENGIEINIK